MPRTTQTGNRNHGAGRSAAKRRPAAAHEDVALSGELRWVERDGLRVVLQVRRARGGAQRFVEQVVTVALDGTRVLADDRNGDGVRDGRDLLPGEQVTVKAAVPERAHRLPDLVVARTLLAQGV